MSFRSVNYPDHYLAPCNDSSVSGAIEANRLCILTEPFPLADASFLINAGLSDSSKYSFSSLSTVRVLSLPFSESAFGSSCKRADFCESLWCAGTLWRRIHRYQRPAVWNLWAVPLSGSRCRADCKASSC